MDNPPPLPTNPPPKRRGCFFYGCLTSLLILLLLGVLVFMTVYIAIKKVNAVVAQYTDTRPMLLEKAEPMPADELDRLKARAAAFEDAILAHTNTPPLVLNSRDLNALLASLPQMKGFKDALVVELSGDQINGQISLPLEKQFKIPFIDFKGRYLNGNGTFKVSMEDGVLHVHVDSLQVRGQPLDPKLMTQLQTHDFAQDIQQGRGGSNVVARYQGIQVTNSTLIITPKKAE